MKAKIRKKRRQTCRFSLHPLFFAVGIFYALKGELLLFLMTALVAVQHECAHAFAASRLGYTLNKIVLMPFGAVIDGDMKGLSLKDEITIAAWGPLCNLFTAAFFTAIWWFTPTMYAFTDTACFSSLSIALVNLLPAYPLDGGRILRCVLVRAFLRKSADAHAAEKKARRLTCAVTIVFALAFFILFFLFFNVSILLFSLFLFVGAFGNKDKSAVYEKMQISCVNALRRGVELRHVAVLQTCAIKDVFRFLSPGAYLVLQVYDEQERHLFNVSQNQLAVYFSHALSPYETLQTLKERIFCPKNTENPQKTI